LLRCKDCMMVCVCFKTSFTVDISAAEAWAGSLQCPGPLQCHYWFWCWIQFNCWWSGPHGLTFESEARYGSWFLNPGPLWYVSSFVVSVLGGPSLCPTLYVGSINAVGVILWAFQLLDTKGCINLLNHRLIHTVAKTIQSSDQSCVSNTSYIKLFKNTTDQNSV
jgi:hypothetical protein